MLCEVKQTVNALHAAFELFNADGALGDALFPDNFLFGGPCVCHYRQSEFVLCYRPASPGRNLFRGAEDRAWVPYSIAMNGEPCGWICEKEQSSGFFSRFSYSFMELFETEYEMYRVGLGKDGIVYPIFVKGRQVAQIEKPTVVRNNLDEYKLCSLNEEAQRAAVLLCLYLDARAFAHRGQIARSSVEKAFFLTTNKTLKAKYDPNFHARAAQM